MFDRGLLYLGLVFKSNATLIIRVIPTKDNFSGVGFMRAGLGWAFSIPYVISVSYVNSKAGTELRKLIDTFMEEIKVPATQSNTELAS